MTTEGRRGRLAIAAIVATVALLFAGRWTAALLAERWWVEGIAPAAVPFLLRWRLVAFALELGAVALAGAWCVGHALWIVRGIRSVEVPRRVGDLEIREVVSGDLLRPGAVIAGLLLGALLGAGAGRAAGTVMLAWQGAPATAPDPVLGLDLGVYLVQLPFWEGLLHGARRLVWSTLVVAALAHLVVGGIRTARAGLAMTEVARRQTGFLTALALLLAALGEALGPLRAVAGLEDGVWSVLPPVIRWAAAGAWAIAAGLLFWWAFRPSARRFLSAAGLWGVPLLLGTLLATATGRNGPGTGPFGARATGAERVTESTLRPDGRIREVQPGLWTRRLFPALVAGQPGARLLAAAPIRLPIDGAPLPVWLLLRDDSAGRSLVVVADDRIAAGGGPVSFREGDPAAYPGIVNWRSVPSILVAPEAPDSLLAPGTGALRVGGTLRRIALAWGTQSRAVLGAPDQRTALAWRRAPHDRVAHLFPPAWWDEPRPYLRDGHLWWVLDGWFLGAGAPLAPAIPWEGGGVVRYARRGLLALVDAGDGTVRLFQRPDADPIATSWAELAGPLVLPADSIPPGLLEGSPSERAVAVVARTLQSGPELPRATITWGPRGPVPQVPFDAGERTAPAEGGLPGLVVDAFEAGFLLVRWPEGAAPLTPRTLNARWGRFASLERLEDSVRSAGGRLEAGEVRYDLQWPNTLAVRVRWALSAVGTPTVAWVEVAEGDRLGAARTPATALANLEGISAPLVPAPDLPDAIHEARRWAARADSALRSGDLEAFARAFEALKRVLGTP